MQKIKKVYLIGIGGIGMSGLALIMKGMGFKIQGSDISSNKSIERLKKNKIKVIIGHQKKNIEKAKNGVCKICGITSLEEGEICGFCLKFKKLGENLPKAKYINNHTGSKFTANKQAMDELLKVLKK